MIFRDRELIFRGSKERLKRNIQKKGGEFPVPGNFRILWRSPYFKWGLTFRMDACYEKTEEGIRIRYRFRPSAGTVLWTGVPVVLLWSYVLWAVRTGNGEGAAAVALFSAMYPVVALWQYASCHKSMCRFFAVETR